MMSITQKHECKRFARVLVCLDYVTDFWPLFSTFFRFVLCPVLCSLFISQVSADCFIATRG